MFLAFCSSLLLVLAGNCHGQELDFDANHISSRTLYFNSTYAGYWIIGGIIAAVIAVKIAAAAYYLYDYYYVPARVDVNQNPYYQDQNYLSQNNYYHYR